MEITNFKIEHPFAYWVALIFCSIAIIGIVLLVLAVAASFIYEDIENEEEDQWPKSWLSRSPFCFSISYLLGRNLQKQPSPKNQNQVQNQKNQNTNVEIHRFTA